MTMRRHCIAHTRPSSWWLRCRCEFEEKVRSMTQFTFRCPGCQQAIACPEQYRGRNVKCPKCQTVIAVPPAAVRPAGTASTSPPRTGPGPSVATPAHRGAMPDTKIRMTPMKWASILAATAFLLLLAVVTLLFVKGRSQPTENARQRQQHPEEPDYEGPLSARCSFAASYLRVCRLVAPVLRSPQEGLFQETRP